MWHTHISYTYTLHIHTYHIYTCPRTTHLYLSVISPPLSVCSLPLSPSLYAPLSLSSLALAISSCPLPFCLWEMQPVPWIACVKWKPTVNTRTLPGIGIRPRQFWTHTHRQLSHIIINIIIINTVSFTLHSLKHTRLVGGFKHGFYFSISYMGCNPSHWRSPSCFKMVIAPPTRYYY